ncbi:MAG: hypothetical protein JWO98_1981 [Frankiales bacterium]|nr:hypothetical protein [Frankiales bacterium]
MHGGSENRAGWREARGAAIHVSSGQSEEEPGGQDADPNDAAAGTASGVDRLDGASEAVRRAGEAAHRAVQLPTDLHSSISELVRTVTVDRGLLAQVTETSAAIAAMTKPAVADWTAMTQLANAVASMSTAFPQQAVTAQWAEIAKRAQPPFIPSKGLLEELTRSAYPPEMTKQWAAVAALAAAPKLTLPGPIFAAQLKALDAITVPAFRHAQLSTTVDAARLMFNDSALETWRTSLLAADTVTRLAGLQRNLLPADLVERLGTSSRLAASLAARLASADDSGRVLRFGTALATRTWQSYLAEDPSPHRVEMAATAGAGVGGLIGADILRLPAERLTDEDVDEVEQAIITPWHSGRTAALQELYVVLEGINPDVVGFLEGGWEDVQRNGAMAASKIAHCAVEALDHTLRTLAPETAVLDWVRGAGQPKRGYLAENGKPTRPARVAYALRDRPDDERLVQGLVDAIAKQVTGVQKQAQGIKHAPGRSTVLQARTVLVTVETVLMQLVVS